uniref:Uncharacterized protein n=1 Tax=Podoviridae sp. ct2m58 TaxID=2827721 RepID=A0A8S5TMP9_9CAUD|nr:MAG TPA: hypothetical protein [Podoviridae sp. ct2m58]
MKSTLLTSSVITPMLSIVVAPSLNKAWIRIVHVGVSLSSHSFKPAYYE